MAERVSDWLDCRAEDDKMVCYFNTEKEYKEFRKNHPEIKSVGYDLKYWEEK